MNMNPNFMDFSDPAMLTKMIEMQAGFMVETNTPKATIQAKADAKAIKDAREQAGLQISIASDKGTPISHVWTGEGYYAPFQNDPGKMVFTRDEAESHFARAYFASEDALIAFMENPNNG